MDCPSAGCTRETTARVMMSMRPSGYSRNTLSTAAVQPALQLLQEKLAACAWDKASIAAAIKEVLGASGLKMPQLAMPVRVLVMGTAQTPSLDAVLALLPQEKVLGRLQSA